jgi:hypothetical protein
MADVTVFDPPYVSVGGRDTSTIPKFLESYGLRDAASPPAGPARLQHARPAARRAGSRSRAAIVLVKCMDYVSSGKTPSRPPAGCSTTPRRRRRSGWCSASSMSADAGPQPKLNLDGTERRAEVHARNNYSTLYIFKKPRRRNAR